MSSAWISDQRVSTLAASTSHSRTPSQTISIRIPSPATSPLIPVAPRTAPPPSPIPSIDLAGPSQGHLSTDTVVRDPPATQDSSINPVVPSPSSQDLSSNLIVPSPRTHSLDISPILPPPPQHTTSNPPNCFSCTSPGLPPLQGLLNNCNLDPNATCRGCDKTPLQHAVQFAVNRNNPRILRDLLKHFPLPTINLEQKYGSGRTLLMECCYKKQLDAALILKDKGAKLDKAQFRKLKGNITKRLWDAFRKEL